MNDIENLDDVPTLDEMLQQIDQPKSPRLHQALEALGMSYVKETA
jgi:NAD-dependent DNA ligase